MGRRELIGRVWPDVIVEEGSLRLHLYNLRKALGDGRDGARYIATVAGSGYSFVAPVERLGHLRGGAANERPDFQKLPPLLQRMIGREETVAALSSLLIERRFVNVVGPGGMGKTTVALAIAHSLQGEFSDQIYFLDLGALRDASLVAGAVTQLWA